MSDIRSQIRARRRHSPLPDLLDDLSLTEKLVNNEIAEAEIYRRMLFDLVRPFADQEELKKLAGEVVLMMHMAVDLAYVMSLSKLFASPKEESLEKLILLASDVVGRPELLELRREHVRSFFRPPMDRAGKQLLSNKEGYIEKIREIRTELSPLRNMHRAHNFPKLPTGKGTSWQTTREWIAFSEEVYSQVMIATGGSAPPIGGFVPATIDGSIENFLEVVRSGLKTAFRSFPTSVV